MTVAQYLVDTSAVVRLLRDPDVHARWKQPVKAGVLAVCPATALELLYSARSKADRQETLDDIRGTFGWVPMPRDAFDRAFEVQASLTDRGAHRSAGLADLLVAATAELHGLTLLHYDHDFDQVALCTTQPTAWLAPSGTID